jgi:DNA invertase Pin-like site-specific DNA recombinase
MTSTDLLPMAVLRRKAVVYVRQSSQTQVQTNLESQRRQYDLVEEARRRGFAQVEVIDDDLGRSASGTVARPGFDRLVAWLCAGEVGAVLCFDASRLARNGRDWHHLLELCGLVEARVIDLDGVYDPCRPNDRLLLGMKGSISEFELGVLKARMLDAARAKAQRGELRISVPIGYVWHREIGLGVRSRHAPARGNPIDLRPIPQAGQRSSGFAVARGRTGSLSPPLGRQEDGEL